jgi:hypothetical protein
MECSNECKNYFECRVENKTDFQHPANAVRRDEIVNAAFKLCAICPCRVDNPKSHDITIRQKVENSRIFCKKVDYVSHKNYREVEVDLSSVCAKDNTDNCPSFEQREPIDWSAYGNDNWCPCCPCDDCGH